MSFVNGCVPDLEIREDELYGPEPFDVNCVLPVPAALSTDKLRLVPFVPRVHAAAYFDGIRGHESMYKYIHVAIERPADFLRAMEHIRRDKNSCLFVAIDTTRPDPDHPEWHGSFAGLFGFIGTDDAKLVTEIGPAIVLPAFQRTHVASHAVCLLLKYLLELPPSGLGLRKVRWSAFLDNAASNRLAERMGFKLEGLARWKYALQVTEGYEKPGNEARVDDAADGLLGVDSNDWALCWDDWEKSGREIVERALARVV